MSSYDTFVAKLCGSGALLWNTFLNSNDAGHDSGIALNGNGDIFLVGGSFQGWGSPIRPFSDKGTAFPSNRTDVFVARLESLR